MQMGRALVMMGFTGGLFVLAAVACDDDPSSKFDESQKDGGSADTGPGFFPDAAGQSDSGGELTCDPTLAESFAPTWKPPAKKSACTTQQMNDYYDACLTTQSADAGDPCKTWIAANGTCGQCLEPADNTGPIQWHRSRYYYTINVAGCLALERGEANEGQCPATYSASIECQRTACDGCFEASNATFQDFQKCQTTAKGTACASFEGKIQQICGPTYNDPDGGAYDCFHKTDDASNKVHFVRVEGIFCGQ